MVLVLDGNVFNFSGSIMLAVNIDYRTHLFVLDKSVIIEKMKYHTDREKVGASLAVVLCKKTEYNDVYLGILTTECNSLCIFVYSNFNIIDYANITNNGMLFFFSVRTLHSYHVNFQYFAVMDWKI